MTGRGHAGERGGPAGDLYVVVRVREDERFLRDGSDLVTVIDVPAPLAALGTTMEVPTLDGAVPVEIKAGTQPGEEIRLGGRGMPPLQRGRTGDLRVIVNVTMPRRLTREQRDMLERFSEHAHGRQPPRRRGHDRQAAARPGGLSAPLVRLGIRVRADRAELALAQLLPLLAAGAEERDVDGDVEYSLYAPRRRAAARAGDPRAGGDAVVDVVSEPVPAGWERRWHEFLRPVRVGAFVVRPPWVDGAAGDLVIDPGVVLRRRHASDDAAVPAAAPGERARRRRCATGAPAPACSRSRRRGSAGSR